MDIINKIKDLKDFYVEDVIYNGYKNLLCIKYLNRQHKDYCEDFHLCIIYTSDKEYKMNFENEKLENLLILEGYHKVQYIAINHVFKNYRMEDIYDPIYVGSEQQNSSWNSRNIYRGFQDGMLGDWTWANDGWDTHGEWEFYEDEGESTDENIYHCHCRNAYEMNKYCDKSRQYRAIIKNKSGIWTYKNNEWTFELDDVIKIKSSLLHNVDKDIKGTNRKIIILKEEA